jgi:hypothetical protein
MDLITNTLLIIALLKLRHVLTLFLADRLSYGEIREYFKPFC